VADECARDSSLFFLFFWTILFSSPGEKWKEKVMIPGPRPFSFSLSFFPLLLSSELFLR